MGKKGSESLNIQIWLLGVTLILFVIKILAWYLTNSVAILSDVLESTVNVLAGFIGLYSLTISSKPSDRNHPYGHGKIEFITSGLEGMMILFAGIIMIFQGIKNLLFPQPIHQIEVGLILILLTGIINYFLGYYSEMKGNKNHSAVLVASGNHLKTDAYSSLGILLGLILLKFTNWKWIDSSIGIIVGIIVVITSLKILQKAGSGIMDEADESILDEMTIILNKNRIPEWIDIHNLRIINYSGDFHVDCHLTVPYYFDQRQSHAILDKMTNLLKHDLHSKIEFFVHVDGCIPKQCRICSIQNCEFRTQSFENNLIWTKTLLQNDDKHYLI